jgi:hypothetical protein
MRNHPNAVTLSPYFKIKPGQLDTVKAMLPKFVERTGTEPRCIFYGFTMHEDELHCQEAYEGAEGVLAHLDNVGQPLGQLLELADLVRLEVHGPAAELDELQEPLASMAPKYFTSQCGLE